ncbi:MAG TPA: hypothetical protein VFT45_28195 [Longimicrobium sp.]|nr:hypothetical protein [Longimicrobium sp.]
MKKTRMSLGDLTVESFRTTPEIRAQRGTVVGHTGNCSFPTWYNECNETVTYGENTCYCIVPRTDAQYCNTNRECTGPGGMC